MHSNRVCPVEIIPRFYTLLSKQQPLTIQGSGLNVRRYLYGADAADGFDTLLHKGIVGEAYNISSMSAVTNFEVAVRILKLFGYSPQDDFRRCLVWISDRPFNDHDYRVDGSKLEALGWHQRVSFEEGLKATIDWYRKNINTWWPEVTEMVSVTSAVTNRNDLLSHVGNNEVNNVHHEVTVADMYGAGNSVPIVD